MVRLGFSTLFCLFIVFLTQNVFCQIQFKKAQNISFYIDTAKTQECDKGLCLATQQNAVAIFYNGKCEKNILSSSFADKYLNNINGVQITSNSNDFHLQIPALPRPITYINSTDFNGDHLQDVLFGNSNVIGIFFQPKDGFSINYDVFWIDTTLADVESIAVGDLNNDNRTDIVALQPFLSQCVIYYQTKNDTFTKSIIPIPQNTANFSHVEIADMNNDSRNDIVLLLNNNLYVFEQTENHTFDNFSIIYENTFVSREYRYNYSSFVLGQLNNDLLTDIVLLGVEGSSLLFYQDSLSKSFLHPESINIFGTVVKIDDLNNDLLNEIISLDKTGLFVLEQNASYQYPSTPQVINNNFYLSLGMAIGDINNDRLKDIAIVGSPLVYYLNESKPQGALIANGRTKVCNDSVFSYRKAQILAKPIIWKITPNQAASIVSSNTDSCMVQWSKTWAGQAVLQWAQVDGCDTIWSDSLIVEREFDKPQVDMPTDLILCRGDTLSINARTARCSYLWNTGSKEAKLLISTNGEYSVTIRNACGSVQRTVIVDGCDVAVPSAFSPNGDGINDVLQVLGKNISNIKFRVFDRWGEMIFESYDFTTAWDGTLHGTPLEAAVFNYTLSATSDADGHLIQKKGTISLVR